MIAYLDIPAGISGDMFLGCLVDAGWSIERLNFAIAQLKLASTEWSVSARQVMKGPMRATLVDVEAQEGHVTRNLADVRKIIDSSDLPPQVKARAIAIFTRLAQAEARVHGTTEDQVYFHEVGAVDALIDIVGASAGTFELGIDKLYASGVPLGSGWATMAHGKMPLPAPATLEILAAAHASTRPAPGPGELVTPTGAAILAQLATFAQPSMTLQRIGIGAGQRDCAWPNIARLWLGQPSTTPTGLVQLETNIDDMNPQLYAAVSDKLFAAGAKDVWFTPVHMKKGRPAVLLSALAPAPQESELSQIILEETTTLGVRVLDVKTRHEARRELRPVDTPFGTLNVKLKYLGTPEQPIAAMPEYEDCKSLAEKSHVPTRTVWEAALAAGQSLLNELQHP